VPSAPVNHFGRALCCEVGGILQQRLAAAVATPVQACEDAHCEPGCSCGESEPGSAVEVGQERLERLVQDLVGCLALVDVARASPPNAPLQRCCAW